MIAGAGYAGAALAIALDACLKGEARTALIDRNDPRAVAQSRDPRCFAISAGSKRMLSALGLWPDVEAAAEPVIAIDITDSSLDTVFRSPLLSYDNSLGDGEAASYIVESQALRQAAAAALSRLRQTTFLAGRSAASFFTDASGLTVALDDGETITGGLLIAADGKSSALREAAGIKSIGWKYGQVGITAIITHEKPHGGKAVQHFLPAGPFAILPLKGNRSCITWTEEEKLGRELTNGPEAAFLAAAGKRFGYRLGELKLEAQRACWPLELRLARRFVAGRFALVGDAARAVHPIAGQGLNLGLRDVAALAEVVAGAMRLGLEPGSASALARYERWRRFDSVASAAMMDGLNRLFSNDWPLLRTVRDVGLGIVDRAPELKKLFVTEAAGLLGEVPSLLQGRVP
ncbi:MAG: ubiquinone biosynthesis protein UbiH [Hyphomicrobiaceae bacterium]|nr:MAG: ubiquinone biosynthesis protein UbiH [Hyphomicrobiaceae bacterium]